MQNNIGRINGRVITLAKKLLEKQRNPPVVFRVEKQKMVMVRFFISG